MSRLIAGQVALALVIATVTGLLLLQLHDRALSGAEHELRSTSLLLAEQAERAFEAVNLVQTAIVDGFHIDSVHTQAEFRQRVAGIAVHDELVSRVNTLPQLEAVTVIDDQGALLNFSRFWPVPVVNVADRDYFKSLKDDPERTTYVSAPVQNRGSGTWNIYLARKVVGTDGAFLGLVLAAVPLSYFEKLYLQVASGADFAISMFRKDGILLARYPHSDLQIGQSFGPRLAFTQQAANDTNGVVIRKISEVDGRERLIGARSLVRFPIVVNVMDTVSSILAEWRKQAIYLIGAAVAIEAVVAAIGALAMRHMSGQRLLSDARAAKAEAEAELAVAHERERADRERRTQNVRFEAALSNMSQALCLFDSDDCLVVANSRLAEMFGRPGRSILPGMSIEALGITDEADPRCVDAGFSIGDIQQLRCVNVRAKRVCELADGRILAVNFAPVEDDGWLLTLEDISEQEIAKARIMHMANHDALTGLANRALFHEKLTEAVARTVRGEQCAVLLLDLDQFKAVNDSLGHPVGDALLRAVTLRLRGVLRETDTVARLGGDEFAIVQSNVVELHDATALANRLMEAVSLPYELEGHQVMIGASIGIAVVPGDGTDPDLILRNADMALYRAKSDGRCRYRFFEPAMDALMQARRGLETALRKGLVSSEFSLFYQPLMNLRTDSVIGFEALMRWFHPERGMVSPADFIPLAEEIGLLVPLGAWALRRACLDAAAWPEHIKVAVNVSATQFGSRTLVADVATALRDSGLAPSRLELEVTETVMLEDTDDVLRIMHELRDLGVGIALDDFGTGYSSLSYLRRFPFTKVKIDRSFVEGLGKRGDSEAIVITVIDLCDMLGMIVLAEGVETEDQLRRLRVRNCGEAQGYYFSRPQPVGEVPELCRRLTRPLLAEAVSEG